MKKLFFIALVTLTLRTFGSGDTKLLVTALTDNSMGQYIQLAIQKAQGENKSVTLRASNRYYPRAINQQKTSPYPMRTHIVKH